MIQVYTGNGKGKTTAAMGLALRAAGAGLKVYIAQFCKGKSSGEIKALRKIKNITLEQFGSGCFIKNAPSKEDKQLALAALRKINGIISQKRYDVIILDEINAALSLKLFPLEKFLKIITKLPKKTELIITGRYADSRVLKIADLVSEIKEVKHYFNKGVKARKGIEF